MTLVSGVLVCIDSSSDGFLVGWAEEGVSVIFVGYFFFFFFFVQEEEEEEKNYFLTKKKFVSQEKNFLKKIF